MTALPTITALPTAPSRSDVPATFITRADAWVGALGALVTEINAFGAAVITLGSATNYSGTSTTSLAIGTGSKSLTIQADKAWQVGQFATIASTASPANYMTGQVTAYNSTTGALTVNVTGTGGTGTFAAWTVSMAMGAGGYATLTGAETLTNKTLTTPVLSGTASGTVAGRVGYLSGALTFGDGTVQRTVATLDGAQTFTNKTIVLASNSLSGTLADYSADCTDDDFVGLAATQTLTNKTLTTPLLSSTASGTTAGRIGYSAGVLTFGDGSAQRTVATLDGTQTFTNKTLTSPTLTSPTLTTPTIDGAQVPTVSGTAPLYMARAFCSFNTAGLIAGKNVSSVTRIAAGRYTVAFATAMPAATYIMVGSGVMSGVYSVSPGLASGRTTTSCEVDTPCGGSGYADTNWAEAHVAFFG